MGRIFKKRVYWNVEVLGIVRATFSFTFVSGTPWYQITICAGIGAVDGVGYGVGKCEDLGRRGTKDLGRRGNNARFLASHTF